MRVSMFRLSCGQNTKTTHIIKLVILACFVCLAVCFAYSGHLSNCTYFQNDCLDRSWSNQYIVIELVSYDKMSFDYVE